MHTSAIRNTIEATAAGKVTLFHRYYARRSDGLLPLQSLFVPVDARDRVRMELSVEKTEPTLIRRHEADGGGTFAPPPEDDICLRAAKHVLTLVGESSHPVRIRVDKGIPIAAGMGGGSADAAAILEALPRAFGLDREVVDKSDLTKLSFDIPAFRTGGVCFYDGDPRVPRPLREYRGFDLYAAVGPRSPSQTTHAVMSRLGVPAGVERDSSFDGCLEAFRVGNLTAFRASTSDLRRLMNKADRRHADELIAALREGTGIPFVMTGTGPYVVAPVEPREVDPIRAVTREVGGYTMVLRPWRPGQSHRTDV